MKKKVHISLKLIIIILMTIVGGYFCIKGAMDLSGLNKAIEFNDLKESDIKDGTYVRGYVEKFVIRTQTVNDEEVRSAVSQTLIDYQCESDIYTIPVKEDKYIQLMARSERAKEDLNSMLEATNEKAYFEGIVVKRNIEVNKPWYGAVDKRLYPGINDIISEYYVREIDKNDFWNDIKLGSLLVAIAVLLFIDGGGFEGLVEEVNIKEEIRKTAKLEDDINKEEELLNRETVLRYLTRRQKRIKKKKPSSIRLMILGVIWTFGIPKLFFIGLLIVAFGAKGFLEWFINSSNIHGIKLAKKIQYDSLYIMIEQCKRDINELEELIYNEEQDKGIKY